MTEQYVDNKLDTQLTSAVVDQALQYVGDDAKKLIKEHIRRKYGLDFALVGEYKTEFENYLRETFFESAEIIILKIRSVLENSRKGIVAAKPTLNRISRKVSFLFCDQCFWSASVLNESFDSRCMSCNNEIKCALPISSNEVFSYELNDKRGITLYFS